MAEPVPTGVPLADSPCADPPVPRRAPSRTMTNSAGLLASLDRVTADDRRARWRIRTSTGARQVAPGHVGDTLAGVVNWGTCNEADVPELELMSVYVAAAHHSTGAASALLTHALGHAPAHLWVFEDNPRAQAFYAKSGFSPGGNRKVDPDTGIWEQRLIRN